MHRQTTRADAKKVATGAGTQPFLFEPEVSKKQDTFDLDECLTDETAELSEGFYSEENAEYPVHERAKSSVTKGKNSTKETTVSKPTAAALCFTVQVFYYATDQNLKFIFKIRIRLELL